MENKSGTKSAWHDFLVVSYEVVMTLLFCLPRYSLFNYCKSIFLSMRGAKIGHRVTFYSGAWILPGNKLEIGDDVNIAKDVIIDTTGGVKIGDRALIGFRSQIYSENHVIPKDHGMIFGAGHSLKPIIIEKDVWIGANSLILAGVTIGEGAVVGGGSVVTKSVAPFTIVGGNPAKFLKERE